MKLTLFLVLLELLVPLNNFIMSKKIKLIIFDAAGVVWYGGYIPTCKFIAKKYKKPFKEVYDIFWRKWFLKSCTGEITSVESFKKSADELNIKATGNELEKIHLRLHQVNQDTLDFALELKKAGYKTVLLSNNFAKYIKLFKIKFNLSLYFTEIINSQDVGLNKCSQEMFEYVLKKYQVKSEEAIYFDDLKEFLHIPQGIGINTFWFNNLKEVRKSVYSLIKPEKLIILDLHGVILNGDYWVTARYLHKNYGVDIKEAYDALYTEHCLAAMKKISGLQVFPRAIKNLGIKADPQKIWNYHLRMTSRRNESIIAYAQVLRRRGYTVIGLSKSFPILFDGNLKGSKIIKRKEFDDMINTYDLNLPKASEKTIREVMKKFGIKNSKDIIYIDDQESNLKDPRKMGVQVYLYDNFKNMRKWMSNHKS